MAMTEIVISSLFEFVPFTSPLTLDLYYVSYPVRAIRVNDLVFHSGMGLFQNGPIFFTLQSVFILIKFLAIECQRCTLFSLIQIFSEF